MKKIVTISLLLTLLMSESKIMAPPIEESHSPEEIQKEKAPTPEEVAQHNATMFEKMKQSQMSPSMKNDSTSSNSMTTHSATESSHSGGLSFKPNQKQQISLADGSTANIETDEHGRITQSVVSPKESIQRRITNSMRLTSKEPETLISHKDGVISSKKAGSNIENITNADGTKTVRLTKANGDIITEDTTDPANNDRPVKRVVAIPDGPNGQQARVQTFEMNHSKNERTDTTDYPDGSSKLITTNAQNIRIKSVFVDKDGNKTTTEYENNGELQRELITNKNGQTTKETLVNPKNETTTTAKYDVATGKPKSIETINEINHTTSHQEFDDNGNYVTTTTDKNGEVTSIVTKNGNVITTKDGQGNVIKTNTITKIADGSGEVHTTEHTGGSTITEAFNNKGVRTDAIVEGKITNTISKYDENSGELQDESVEDKEENVLTHTVVDNQAGNTTITRHDINTHQPMSQEIIDHNTDSSITNNLTMSPVVTHEGKMTTTIEPITGNKTVVETGKQEITTSEYDKDGTLLSQSFHDPATGKILENILVHADGSKTTTKYDDNGQKESQNTENADGDVIAATRFNEDGSFEHLDPNTGEPLPNQSMNAGANSPGSVARPLSA